MKTNIGKEDDKNGNKAGPATGKYGICDGSTEVCADPKIKMIACILSFENGTFSWIMVLMQYGVALGRMIPVLASITSFATCGLQVSFW